MASAPAETLKQHLATESSDCDQGWSTESVSPPLASALAESTPTYEWTMLDTAPRPRHTSSAPAKRDSTASATIRTEPIMGPYPSTGPRLIQVAAYDVARESQTKDGKLPVQLPDWLQKELLHHKTCEYCRKLGMVQTRVDQDGNCPFDPRKPMDPRQGHWQVWLCIYISGIDGTPALLNLGWTDAALEASKKAKPDEFKKYARLLNNTTVLNSRMHNKAERADSASKTQPATGTQRVNQLGENQ